MKGPSCALVASVVAASTAALSSSSDAGDRDAAFHGPSSPDSRYESSQQMKSSRTDPSDKSKFAPRFDGLRFIETLVTAHK